MVAVNNKGFYACIGEKTTEISGLVDFPRHLW
jgi:hypothetical protein